MLSVVIPSYKEQYLQKTIDDLRQHAETDIEIVAVLDGYDDVIRDAKVVRLEKNQGMRGAINAGVAAATGDFIMKIDGHCSFDQGFDRKLLEDIWPNWVVIPRRYDLNPDTWEIIGDHYSDYDKLVIHATRNKFHGEYWRQRHKERKDVLIDETMCFQGSAWVMSRYWWETIGPLQVEGFGTFTQEPVEISFKTWQAGGKLMVNKNTWYAHKHRDWSRTHNVSRADADAGNQYALELYYEYYKDVIKPRFGFT